MARHLNTERWMSLLTSPTGQRYRRLKRVSRAREAHFPRDLREIWLSRGPASLTREVKDRGGLTLAEAWAERLAARLRLQVTYRPNDIWRLP